MSEELSAISGQLEKLVAVWQRRARRKFRDAAGEDDTMGKRLIEHGAMCYFNCSQELQRVVDGLAPSATPAAGQTSSKGQVL